MLSLGVALLGATEQKRQHCYSDPNSVCVIASLERGHFLSSVVYIAYIVTSGVRLSW